MAARTTAKESQSLQLLIKPAGADCNMACRYCFYRRVGRQYPEPTPHRMSDETLQSVVRRYLRLRLPQSVFCWQGGEPTLMGIDFFRRAVQLMERFGVSRQPVSNAFQTNGLLLDHEWCAFFRQYRFLIGLSLDGMQELHDAYRIAGGNRGSHADVIRSLRLLQDEQVESNVLAVVTDVSARHAAGIYKYFRELGVRHMQFIPCIEADASTRKPAPFSVTPEAYGDFLCALFDAWLPEAKAGISVRLFDGLLQRELTGNSGLCYLDGTCGSCPVIEHNGEVYPCDFFVQPEWRLGSIRTMAFEKLIQRSRARSFRGARYRLPEACSDCEWAALCRGGCLKDRQRITGGFDAPTYFCGALRRFLAHAAEPIRRLATDLCPPDLEAAGNG